MRTSFLSLLLLAACGGPQKVDPDETTATGHRTEAEKEREAARADFLRYQQASRTPEGETSRTPRGAFSSSGEYLYPLQSYDPLQAHLDDAARHSAHARAHESAADELERFAEAECRDFPPQTRAVCPVIGPATAYAEIPGGVRVTLALGSNVPAVVAHVRCHVAFARARGRQPECPLYVTGVRVAPTADGRSIEITTTGDVDSLRRTARRVIVVHRL